MFITDDDAKVFYGCFAICAVIILIVGVLIGTSCAHNPYRIQIVKEAR